MDYLVRLMYMAGKASFSSRFFSFRLAMEFREADMIFSNLFLKERAEASRASLDLDDFCPQDKMEAYSSYGHRLRHLGGP
jgi:hypothetical protein